MIRSFAIVVGLAAAAGALIGCSSSSPSTTGSTSTGGATSGSTTGGGSSTSGTTGASASSTGSTGSTGSSGSSGGSSGSSGTTGSEPTCPVAQRWDGSACAPAPTAYVSVTQYEYFLSDGGRDPRFTGSAEALFFTYRDSGYPDETATIAPGCSFTRTDYFPDGGYLTANLADGGTMASSYGLNNGLTSESWGDLTIVGAEPGTLTVDQDGGQGVLYPSGSNYGEVGDVFSGGETITLNATGSAVFPAWNPSLVAPPKLVLQVGTFVAGQPWTVSWTGSSAQPLDFWGDVFDATAAGTSASWSFFCHRIPDTGSYTLSASDTAHAPASGESGFVRAERLVSVTEEPGQSFVTEQFLVIGDAETNFIPQ